jgi:nitroimidazol reductase NimA-like FMN-containing flavoprotein (pyridoxamine 5'-phosphate oxidase superfamily)
LAFRRCDTERVNLPEARRTFKDVPAVRVGSLLSDGSPHVVPLWFVWLEDAVFVSSRERSQVWRNLLRDPRVVLQFDRGRAWTEHVGALIQGQAEALDKNDPSAQRALSAWFEKYRSDLAGPGFAAYTEQVADPVILRIRPDRLATWMHAASTR